MRLTTNTNPRHRHCKLSLSLETDDQNFAIRQLFEDIHCAIPSVMLAVATYQLSMTVLMNE